jgi:hypothetical protein
VQTISGDGNCLFRSLNYMCVQRKLFLTITVTRWNFNGRCASLLERRAVGQQDTPNLVISMPGKKEVSESRSGLRPSEKELPERRSVTKNTPGYHDCPRIPAWGIPVCRATRRENPPWWCHQPNSRQTTRPRKGNSLQTTLTSRMLLGKPRRSIPGERTRFVKVCVHFITC